jgi:hypothetical protein
LPEDHFTPKGRLAGIRHFAMRRGFEIREWLKWLKNRRAERFGRYIKQQIPHAPLRGGSE